jgi:hypothetical protein
MNLLIAFADDKYPCPLGLINNVTKILASRQSEHGWRGMVSVSNLTAGVRLGRTFQEGPAIRGKLWMRECTRPVGGGTISRFMSGWLKAGSASAIILLLTSAKKLLTAHQNCSQKKFLAKFAHGESILLMENHELPFTLLAI